MSEFTHFDADGAARMVDVTEKDITDREAIARAAVYASAETLTKIRDRAFSKGDVLDVARLAGIMGAKRTSDLIPLCHPLPVSSVKLDLSVDDDRSCVDIEARVRVTGRTGVEMEALTAVTVAALTVYDMCKSVDKGMVVGDVRLVRKTGGKSGTYARPGEAQPTAGGE
ncbi:cyclic pyranopterin monophosphate synthase MoaC [Candidatus Poribacteria bacterium]|nr:cyclic pyranopterin monophosphate synthase MoaC [Candidatus Poribacteria bacterium]MBT5536039.1 cyclic pyranopterin monophosphate synthase MoaC [Candidatus Poribacteria bacterium]MBT5709401.1 cyclic pyranopterin monophosphate synthase MoaC [Candidatus Poribacteria bacterium]MBT7096244.1 cyclic pyranopterin monophosphate synthase MoaC [Candidatus Poribacteria bacterium]MBT7807983.1 cyclic pyranopterin monophosphate synthase MoaC [Candidatus Poribacteria bacterium]